MPIDYKDFEKGNQAKATGDGAYWWQREGDEVAKGVVDAARLMAEAQVERYQLNLRCARLYGNHDFVGWGPKEYATSASFSPLQKANQIALNLAASCVDTLEAKIAKTTPRPMFLTDGGKWSQRQAAKMLDRFTRGFFYESKMQSLMARQAKDGFILEFGVIHLFINHDTKRVCAERVLAPELRWDDAEAVYGEPRQLFRVKVWPKDVVRSVWGKKGNGQVRTDVMEALRKAGTKEGANSVGTDMVEVVEAWHLPSSEKADDGMHALCIEGANLIEPEEYKRCRFPFSIYRFSERMQGFSGQSLVERLMGRQLEINKTLQGIAEVMRRKGRGRTWVPRGAKVILSHLTNGNMDVVEYDGPVPPTHDAAPVVSQEDINWLRMNWTDGFEEAGISQLSASAKNPFGANPSGKAFEVYNDVESERFIMLGKRREAVALDIIELAIDLVKEVVAETDKEYEVSFPDKGKLGRVAWKKIDLKRDDYVMQMFPVSSLPQTPAAKLAHVEKLQAMGAIATQAEALRLLDFPDLTAENNLSLAALEYVDYFIAEIIEGEDFKDAQYDPFCNLQLLLERGTNSYLLAKMQGCPEERLTKLADTLKVVAEELAPKPPPGPPPGPPMPGADAGMVPGAPPLPGGDMPMGGMPPGGAPPLPM